MAAGLGKLTTTDNLGSAVVEDCIARHRLGMDAQALFTDDSLV